jgi:hypothetical protein
MEAPMILERLEKILFSAWTLTENRLIPELDKELQQVSK